MSPARHEFSQTKRAALRKVLKEGEKSGFKTYDFKEIMKKIDAGSGRYTNPQKKCYT